MKKTLSFIIFLLLLYTLYGSVIFAGQGVKPENNPEALHKTQEIQEDIPPLPIKLYQDYVSSADGDRCRMYPTCSQYCSEAIRKHGALLGWIMCSDRLIRGGRDETTLSEPVWIDGKKRTYDPVIDNDFWWH
jgi:putative membrane protein insertion efficiency factor